MNEISIGYISDVTHTPNALRFLVDIWYTNILWFGNIWPIVAYALPDSPIVRKKEGEGRISMPLNLQRWQRWSYWLNMSDLDQS